MSVTYRERGNYPNAQAELNSAYTCSAFNYAGVTGFYYHLTTAVVHALLAIVDAIREHR